MSACFGSVVFFFVWGDLLATCVTGSGLSPKLSVDFTDVSGDNGSFFLLGDGLTDFIFFGSVVCLVCWGEFDTGVVVEDGFSFKLFGDDVSFLSKESVDVLRDKLSSEAFWSSAALSCAARHFSAKPGFLNSNAAMYATHTGSNEVGFSSMNLWQEM